MTQKKIIPIIPIIPQNEGPEIADETSACSSAEPYALMVLGDSMLPEFEEGEIIIIEPEGLAHNGAYVVAWHKEEYIFRQLVQHSERWYLKPLNDLYPTDEVPGLEVVKGVVTQKKKPGKRSSMKSY
ncbi:MAG: LexA family protein [Sulfuricella sp.]